MASFAATRAMGKPVALDARAEDRDTRGFISMISNFPFSGLTANWTLEPPVSTPISRSTAIEALRMIWYSLSVSVSAGATVMESPVCTPMGSIFSMEHTMMQLSAWSRTTSISNSFHPSTDSSTSTWPTGDASRPVSMMALNSSSVAAMPPPMPPRVNDGRMISGRPMATSACLASSNDSARRLFGHSSPIFSIASRN